MGSAVEIETSRVHPGVSLCPPTVTFRAHPWDGVYPRQRSM
jgi:hypothetical protein